MKRWQGLVFCLGVTLVAPTLELAASETPTVSSAQIRTSGLKGVTKKGSVVLLGFSWVGEARLFDEGLPVAEIAELGPGDLDFTIIAKGGSEVCEGFERLGSGGELMGKARLTFKSAEGHAASFRLAGLSVERTDCGSKPWTASLRAKKVSSGDTKEDSKRKGGKRTSPEDIGAHS